MYEAQQAKDKEQTCLLTDHGIYWLDDVANTHGSSVVGPADAYGGQPGAKWFIENGFVINIIAIVHTHPSSGAQSGSGMSAADLAISTAFGVPNYAIHHTGIYVANPNGTQGVADNNMATAFNCNLANNTFRYY